MRKTQKYKLGVQWIANNDEPGEMDVDAVVDQISTLLLSDLFGVPPLVVAKDIVAFRWKIDEGHRDTGPIWDI